MEGNNDAPSPSSQPRGQDEKRDDDPIAPSELRFEVSGSSTLSCSSFDMVGDTSVALQIPATSSLAPPLFVSGCISQPALDSSHSPLEEAPELLAEGNAQLRWLELQAVGACRTDERLCPLLRWDLSCFGADGRLLARLGLHFKAKELGRLARCLCAPLVSIRVGKVISQGQVLRPTSTRGHLKLTMLPTSVLRLSFTDDKGLVENLTELVPYATESPVVLETLEADASSRSFVLRLPGGVLAFFWQSEKVKDIGEELLRKMEDLLLRRPTLAQMTGIQQSRLEILASYLSSSLPPSSPPIATRSSESATVPPSPLPVAKPELIHMMCSESLPIADTSDPASTSVTPTASAPLSLPAFGQLTGFLADANDRNSRNLLLQEMDRIALAKRLLESSLVPFPSLLVSSSASLPPLMPPSQPSLLSSAPYYCPCPMGSVSALQCTTLATPFLPALPSPVASASELQLPPPPLPGTLPLPHILSPPPASLPLSFISRDGLFATLALAGASSPFDASAASAAAAAEALVSAGDGRGDACELPDVLQSGSGNTEDGNEQNRVSLE